MTSLHPLQYPIPSQKYQVAFVLFPFLSPQNLNDLKVTEIAHVRPTAHVGVYTFDGNNSNGPSMIIGQTPTPHLEQREGNRAAPPQGHPGSALEHSQAAGL